MALFSTVDAIHPRRSVFNLSNIVKTTMDAGILVPFFCRECLPGDKWKLGNRIVVRCQPMVAPAYHRITIRTEYFFVPTRLLWKDWETFLSKGVSGDETLVPPVWIPCRVDESDAAKDAAIGTNTLWDYFGFPTRYVGSDSTAPGYKQWDGFPVGSDVPDGAPVDFVRRAYYKIMADYYLDETLDQSFLEEIIDFDNSYKPNGTPKFQTLVARRWRKDYFTSALQNTQRGDAPAIPLSGVLPVEMTPSGRAVRMGLQGGTQGPAWTGGSAGGTADFNGNAVSRKTGTNELVPFGQNVRLETELTDTGIKTLTNGQMTVNLAEALTFTPVDLRYAFQVQLWQEQNARGGVRYTEFLRSHWGVSPRDDRLQRAEFISSTSQPLIVSEVLQTSETTSTSPQGNLAGHGISADGGRVGSYYCQEPGFIIGLISIVPKADYQQGIMREFLRRSPFDYGFPEFVHLSEQGITESEIYLRGVDGNTVQGDNHLFGYQGRFDEYRTAHNQISGDFRTKLDYWHMGRQFASAPGLNNRFINMFNDSAAFKRPFQVQNEPTYLVQIANDVTAIRPLPYESIPGLIDHKS